MEVILLSCLANALLPAVFLCAAALRWAHVTEGGTVGTRSDLRLKSQVEHSGHAQQVLARRRPGSVPQLHLCHGNGGQRSVLMLTQHIDDIMKCLYQSEGAVFMVTVLVSSAGTNNARLAAMLRQLAQYHAKDPNNLFMVRLAQVSSTDMDLIMSEATFPLSELNRSGL